MSDAHDHDHLNCQATLARLYPYLDRELDESELAAVQEHLNRCGPCAKLFHVEDNILTFIGQRLAHTQAPPDLRSRITRLCSERGER